MRAKDFIVAWRQLVAEPAYAVVVSLGLAVAIGCVYLCAATLWDRLLPDPSVPEPQRLVSMDFRLNVPGRDDDWFGGAPLVLRKALLDAGAPVNGVTRVVSGIWSVRAGDKLVRADGLLADPDVVPLFGMRPLAGDIEAALARPDAIVLTEVFARRLFDGEALGRQVSVNGRSFTVAAITPRPAGSSALQFDALAGFESPANAASMQARESWSVVAGRVFARLGPGTSAAALGELAQSLFDASAARTEFAPEQLARGRSAAFVRAVPLHRLIIDGAGSARLMPLLAGVAAAAAAMLALAAINYVNLTTVRTLARQREIGIRKSLGASPLQLIGQFLIESTVVAVCAGAIGLWLVWLVAPSYADLISYRFDDRLFAPPKLLVLLGGCVLVGLLTGIYPAYLALRVNCAAALAGRDRSETASGRWLRRSLTTVQIGVSITLAVVAITVLWQSDFARRVATGFDVADVVAIDLPRNAAPERSSALRDALAQAAGVQAVGWSSDVPGRDAVGQIVTVRAENREAAVRVTVSDAGFFRAYRIALLAGSVEGVREGEGEDPVALDLAAVEALDLGSPQAAIGRALKSGDSNLRVVAVTGRLRQESARSAATPQAFRLSAQPQRVLNVRSSDRAAARRAAEQLGLRYFPEDAVIVDAVDSYVALNYIQDRVVGILVGWTGVIALVLAGFGTYALAAHTVMRKRREIVVRKLYGASNAAIAGLLVREFGLLVGVGVLVGVPLGWLLRQQYLGGFVLRAPFGLWPEVAALSIALVMACVAVLRHTRAAIATRPLQALREP